MMPHPRTPHTPRTPLAALLLIAALLIGAAGLARTCAAADPPLSDVLRKVSDDVKKMEGENDALRRENQALKNVPQAKQAALQAVPKAAGGLTVVAAGAVAPAAVHLCALDVPLATATPLTATYAWTFTDADGRATPAVGWNAAHVFDLPGTGKVHLTVTEPDGTAHAFDRDFPVAPDNRRSVYVSTDGRDEADGSTPDLAVKSVARAGQLAADSTRLLFRRGDVFPVYDKLDLAARDLCLRAYGDSAKPLPVLMASPGRGGKPPQGIVGIRPSAEGILLENLAFDTDPALSAGNTDKTNLAFGIQAAGGRNLVVRGCLFRNVVDGFNGNGNPTGVLIQGNLAPLLTGIRGYFVWGAGSDYVIDRNRVANTTREHCVRFNPLDRVTVTANVFANPDRRAEGDRWDTSKGAITVQAGSYAYLSGNDCPTGAVSIGPLGEGDGLKHRESRWRFAVVERNRLGQMFEVKHGAEHVVARGNRIDAPDGRAVEIEGFNPDFGRGVSDLTVVRNTAVNSGKTGGFLRVMGPVQGLAVTDNLYVAPDTRPGGYGTAAVNVSGTDTAGMAFTGNLWATGKPSAFAAGGCMIVATKGGDGYLTPAQWSALPAVSGDRFEALADPAAAPPGVGCDPAALPTFAPIAGFQTLDKTAGGGQ